MNAAGENSLRTLIATTNSQFENHLLLAVFALATGELELDCGFVFGLPKAGQIKPMATRLRSPAKAECREQEIGRRADSLVRVEVRIGEVA
jgi:hypothetical protein